MLAAAVENGQPPQYGEQQRYVNAVTMEAMTQEDAEVHAADEGWYLTSLKWALFGHGLIAFSFFVVQPNTSDGHDGYGVFSRLDYENADGNIDHGFHVASFCIGLGSLVCPFIAPCPDLLHVLHPDQRHRHFVLRVLLWGGPCAAWGARQVCSPEPGGRLLRLGRGSRRHRRDMHQRTAVLESEGPLLQHDGHSEPVHPLGLHEKRNTRL